VKQLSYSNIDKTLSDVYLRMNFLGYLLPTNFQEENDKFKRAYLNGNIYNPQYVYRKIKEVDFNEIRNNLTKFYLDDNKIGNLYLGSVESIHNDLKLLESIGDSKLFTELGKVRCGKPKMVYAKMAKECLKFDEKTELYEYSPNELKMHLEKCINFYSLKWNIQISDDMPSKVRVDSKIKKVSINGNHKYSENDIKRLCVHEISTHVLRTENGALREYGIFKFGTSNGQITEEGLALYNEEIAGVSNISILKLYAARFLSSINIDTMSFYEMVQEIEPYIGLNNAIHVVARFKVGIKDTSDVGGYVNDFIYFQGYQDVKNSVSTDLSLYKKLYYGCIGLNDVKLFEKEIETAITSRNIILPNLLIV
jgi:hypothetical protein